MNKKHALLFGEIKSVVDSGMDTDDILRFVCQILRDGVPHFDWVGFYKYNEEERKLYLGAYSGDETEHTVISYGHGVCGQVAQSGEKLIVPDVTAEQNYIACSLTVKSEAVVPVVRSGKAIAQIDVDSDTPDAFSAEDIELLEGTADEIKDFL
ncbi:MAG: GAF domain-containing protein [Flavobacteriales bacterium]|nr:GAF domain-containing protein [Flavobacteriales bacterium]